MADNLRGINQFSFTVSHGIEGLRQHRERQSVGVAAVGRVDFTKIEGYASRLQPLLGSFSALLATYGQYAFNSLLVPEQCGYGGGRFGRAYDPSELLGDSCWMRSPNCATTSPWRHAADAAPGLWLFR